MGDVPRVHSSGVAKPTKASLTEHGEHALHVDTFQYLCVGYFVLPLDVQEVTQASQVEAVEFPIMSCIGSP